MIITTLKLSWKCLHKITVYAQDHMNDDIIVLSVKVMKSCDSGVNVTVDAEVQETLLLHFTSS